MQEGNGKSEENEKNEAKKRMDIDKLKRDFYERSIWGILSLLVIVPGIIVDTLGPFNLEDIILNNYNKIMLSAFIFLIPSLFKLIFGEYPFQYARIREKSKLKDSKYEFVDIGGVTSEVTKEHNLKEEHLQPKNTEITYAELYIKESKEIAERIFSRAGVYLLVGCIVAFTGVGIFFSPIFKTSESRDITQTLIEYLPRFGSLFFIEFVAIFFLKQSKIMLEEYRYYESIKRKRQDHFNFIFLLEKYKDNSDILKIIVEKGDQSVSTKLSNGDTTEILESHKIINSELDIFSKFTDLIKVIKSKEI